MGMIEPMDTQNAENEMGAHAHIAGRAPRPPPATCKGARRATAARGPGRSLGSRAPGRAHRRLTGPVPLPSGLWLSMLITVMLNNVFITTRVSRDRVECNVTCELTWFNVTSD